MDVDKDIVFADRVKEILLPFAKAVHESGCIEYIESVTCISAQKADPETKMHIDEFLSTITGSLLHAGAAQSKAILLMNPARPPVCMTNTLYIFVKEPADKNITQGILLAAKGLEEKFQDFHLRTLPIIEAKCVTIIAEGGGEML